jgi:hypothetical protein
VCGADAIEPVLSGEAPGMVEQPPAAKAAISATEARRRAENRRIEHDPCLAAATRATGPGTEQ